MKRIITVVVALVLVLAGTSAVHAQVFVRAPFVRVQVGPGSVEAAARAARYGALETWAARLGATRIALGHTADDQAETVLMRVLAGAGVRGLAAIPPVRGAIVRPLIEVRGAALRDALTTAGLSWVEDETNREPKFLRNRIRHELLPLLAASYMTEVVPALTRVARLARETVDALDRAAAVELERLASPGGDGLTLPRAALGALPAALAAEVLRQAAARFGSRAPLRAWAHRGLRRLRGTRPPEVDQQPAGLERPPPRARMAFGAVAARQQQRFGRLEPAGAALDVRPTFRPTPARVRRPPCRRARSTSPGGWSCRRSAGRWRRGWCREQATRSRGRPTWSRSTPPRSRASLPCAPGAAAIASTPSVPASAA